MIFKPTKKHLAVMDLHKTLKLDRTQKVALARIITDLIEADFVVEVGEMEFFEKIISREGFSITDTMLVDAKKMDFAKAVSVLSELDLDAKKTILNTLKQLSMSDGTCVPLEAIQIFTLEQVFMHNAKIYSVPSSGVGIGNMNVIYIENEINSATDIIIRENLDIISNKFKLAGFHFVYIPSVVEDFKQLSKEYLGKVVKYMIPSISSERIDDICKKLCQLTTRRFCRDLLYKKIGLNLIDAKPSLLIKINNSDIIDQYEDDNADRIQFSNFLQIELNKDVIDDIHRYVSAYENMVSSTILVESRPKTRKFLYYGFHRSLFDLIAYGKEKKEYKLVFEVSKHNASVYFESLDEHKERIVIKLNPQETALYYMIAKMSLCGEGLDWRERIPSKEKKSILDEYNRIYSYIGKGNSTTEYKDRTQTHHIRTRISVLQCISNSDMFVPEHIYEGKKSLYKIKAKGKYVEMIGI